MRRFRIDTEAADFNDDGPLHGIGEEMWYQLHVVTGYEAIRPQDVQITTQDGLDLRTALDPAHTERFVEVHPESTFCALAGGPLPSKKTAAGVGARLGLLGPSVPAIHEVLASAPEGVAVDDVLDALAAALGAHRFATGRAEVLGSGTDPHGFPLRLVI